VTASLRRLRLVFLLTGLMLASGGVIAGSLAQRAAVALDHTLTIEAEEHSTIVRDHFTRARDIVLVTSQNPVYAQFYARPDRLGTLRASRN
jgi:hypothetical protein